MTHPRQLRSLTLGLSVGAATGALALAILFMLIVVANPTAQAQTFTVLHTFTGGGDGGAPTAGVTLDGAGNLYGTTLEGGDLECNGEGPSCGTVYKLQHRGSGWALNTLYAFTGGSDGDEPGARVVFGPNGALYGTTLFGGLGGVYSGVVFKLSPSPTACKTAQCPWIETALYAFANGARPNFGDVTFDRVGNMYGTALLGEAAATVLFGS